jgi:hypothetical protein
MNAPQCYALRTLPVLFQHASCCFLKFSRLMTKWFSKWALFSGRSWTVVLSLTTDLNATNYMTYWFVSCTTTILLAILVECFWNMMAQSDAREGKWRGNWRIEWLLQYSHTTSERGVSSITNADAHTSAASSRLNWRPCRFKWTRPFRRKTKSGFCACAITFQTHSTQYYCHRNSLVRKRMHMHRRQETKPVLPNNWGKPA